MTKKQLLTWIEQQEKKVCDELDKKRDEALEACTEKIKEDSNLDDIADKIQAKFNEIETMLSEWQAGLEKDIICSREWYGNMHARIYPYINSPVATKKMMLTNDLRLHNSRAHQAVINSYREIEKNVKHEYTSVHVNAQNLKNAALIVEYLESLGFDLTELKEADAKPVTTALAVPINTDFLFLGGTYEDQDN